MTATNRRTPQRIERDRHVSAACALDTVPLLATRVTAMLSWGRRITVAHRWLDSGNHIELKVGMSVDHEMGDRAVRLSVKPCDDACFWVNLAPGINGFGFAAYVSDDSATEDQVWRRWHGGARRNITLVELQGSGPSDGGPGRDEYISIRYWNEHKVGQEWVIGFDNEAYSEAWQERENRGWQLGRESLDTAYCKMLAQHGRFRVRCGYPLAGDACAGADDHVEAEGQLS